MCKRFYITTAIDYVNGQPHLGHAYEKVITDVIARARRSLGESVFFLTGTDEHGQKVQQAAQAVGKTPQAYCDELAAQFQALTVALNLSNDDFIRTTESRHQTVVAALLTKLHDQGDLYKAPYRGWYSWKEETFLTDKDRGPDGTFDPSWGEVTELVEENWYFRMSRHQRWLLEHLEAHPEFVQPDYRRNEILGFLRSVQLDDLCISRPRARLTWGIPLPFDPDYVNYVWFDALTNYLSVPAALGDPGALEPLGAYAAKVEVRGPESEVRSAQAEGRGPKSEGRSAEAEVQSPKAEVRLWPADVHVIGKDIIRFHAVYWPIMLHAAGVPLPRQVLVHGWWQKDGQKMSKTTGNVVDPIAVVRDWGVDAFRYYVVRELDIGPDGNWTDAGFRARYTAELANGLGNLINRSLAMLQRYRGGVVPARSDELATEVQQTTNRLSEQLRAHQLQAALITIWGLVNRANQYVDQTAPFKLAKDPAQATRLDAVLYNLVETSRILAVLLWPFLPATATRIAQQLGLPEVPDHLSAAGWGGLTPGHRIGQPEPLFPRKE
jgi:methionyl-tRNA synthetase